MNATDAATENLDGNVLTKIFRVAWMAVLLGLSIEVVLLVVKLGLGTNPGTIARFFIDLIGRITWSTLICIGLAVAILVSRTGALATSITAFFAAPLATIAARVTHKSVSEALGLTESTTMQATLLLSSVRAIEYCLLGFLLCRLVQRSGVRAAWKYAVIGFLCGLIFGIFGIWLGTVSGTPPLKLPAIVVRMVNEILFPIGCSLVLYVGGILNRGGIDSREMGSHSG